MSTNSQCASCTAPAALFLCARCQTELRAQLHALAHGPKVNGHSTAGLLDACEDVVLRRTRLSTGGGHRKKGDEQPAPFAPDEERLDKDGRVIPSRQEKAARLLTSARNTLSTTIRDLCETRGVECPEIPDVGDMALWLAGNIHAIACDESAGRIRAEVDTLKRSIERVVDKPIRRIWFGDCPTWDERLYRACGIGLWAPEDAIEVRCPRCRASHNADRLKLLLWNDLEREKVPWERILQANKSRPTDEQIPERTLRSWRMSNDGKPPRLRPRGWRRPDGSHGISQRGPDDVPLFLWPDVRRLRDEKPQKVKTGAAARRVR